MKQQPGVDNLRNYPAEIIKELEELLHSGGSALPDPKRKGFYDLENYERTFFIQISSITGRVVLLATWRKTHFGRLDASFYELEERIRFRAYQRYEQRGKRDGHALDDWLQAEAELTERKSLRAAAQGCSRTAFKNPSDLSHNISVIPCDKHFAHLASC
jgi:hypothetical protein